METRGLAVLVTGASRGLGAALVQSLAQSGARVAAVARDEAALAKVVEAARREGGPGSEVHAIVADVADKEATYAIAGSAAALVGPVDVVIHNASTLGPVPLRALSDTDCEDLERALAVNVVGPFRLTKALAGSMALRGRGLVLHISSDAAVTAYATWGAYGASKAAFDHLTKIWAEELRPFGVQFLSVDPGEMDTKMHADAMPEADRSTLGRPALVAERIVRIVQRAQTFAAVARIEASTVDASIIDASTLDASTIGAKVIDAGTVSAQAIDAGTVNASSAAVAS